MLEAMQPETSVRLGRYEISREIGRGAMGVVYLAQDPLIGRPVALKVFRVGFSASDDELRNLYARFIREAQSAGILSHPNIVTVHDVAQAEGDSPAFIAMEYVEGRTLKQILDSPETVSRARAVDLLLQVSAALEYAHSMGVVHRDVKPGNILVTDSDQVKITDFGIALVNSGNTTNQAQLLGTPSYMAPEAIEQGDVDHRADLFSLGVVFYEMLTRHKPFTGRDMMKVTHRIVNDPFTPAGRYVAELPAQVDTILERALHKDPTQRYQSAVQFGRALEAVREEQPTGRETVFMKVEPKEGQGASREETSPFETGSVEIEVVPEARPAGAAKGATRSASAPSRENTASPRRTSFPSRIAGALRQTTPIGRIPVWLLLLGILVGIPAAFYSVQAEPTSPSEMAPLEPPRVGALEPLVGRTRELRESAASWIESGDLEAARVLLAEAARIDPDGIRTRSELSQVESRSRAVRTQWRDDIDEALSAARRSLASGKTRDAETFAEQVLVLDPMNLEAPELILQAQSMRSRARARARREEESKPIAVVAVETVAPEASEPEPAEEVIAEPEPEVSLATPGTFVVEIVAARSPGVVTVYDGDEQLFRERFKFVGERKGILNKKLIKSLASKGGAGELNREFLRVPGEMALRVYVSMPGEATQVITLDDELEPGGLLSLSIDIDAQGRATAVVR